MSGFWDERKKKAIRERFNVLAAQRAHWQKRGRYYYEEQVRYCRFLVPEGASILEVGCGLGDLLAAVKPSRGLGLELSEEMVAAASLRHPSLEFRVGDVENLTIIETFDVIILSDVVGHLLDVEAALKQLRQCCSPKTRIVISYYNFLWEPIVRSAEKLE